MAYEPVKKLDESRKVEILKKLEQAVIASDKDSADTILITFLYLTSNLSIPLQRRMNALSIL
jgi:hypothetical protein